MNDLIEKLSYLRSQYNCFDENEHEAYHALSEAIKVLSERPELCDDPRADVYYLAEKIGIHRLYALVVELRGEPKPCEDDKHCSNCIYSGRPTYKSPCSECHDNSQWEMKPISRSHENDVECEDAVSRKAVYDAMVEKGQRSHRYRLGETWELNGTEIREALDTVPSVTPKQAPCEDAISRKSILDKISKKDNWEKYDRYNIGLSDARRIVQDDPSVTPKRNTGNWIPHSEKCREYIGTVLVNVEYDYWFCDTCGYQVEKGQPMYNFCPNCGAKMEV